MPNRDLLITNQPCVRCGYDLYGLPHAGACPECGVLVARSLRSRNLLDASPAWLSNLAFGLFLLKWALLVITASAVAVIVVLAASSSWWEGLETFFNSVLWVMLLAAFAAFCGLLLATAPDPAAVCRQEGLTGRRLTRVVALTIAATALMLVFSPYSRMLGAPIVANGLWTVAAILVAALPFACARLLKGLFQRGGDSHGSRSADRVALCGALLAPIFAVYVLALPGNLLASVSLFAITFLVVLVLAPLTLILMLSLIWRAKRMLRSFSAPRATR